MSLKSPFTTNIQRGAYSAIVFIDGDLIVVEDAVGSTIKESSLASTAIQAALDSLSGNGGKVFINAGDYNCQSAITLPQKNTVLEGASGGHPYDTAKLPATRLYFSNNTTGLTTAITSGAVYPNDFNHSLYVKNIAITGTQAAGTRGIFFRKKTDVSYIEGCWVDKFDYGIQLGEDGIGDSADSIYVLKSHISRSNIGIYGDTLGGSSMIDHNMIADCEGDHIKIVNGCCHVWITNNEFVSPLSAVKGYAIKIEDGAENGPGTISGNMVYIGPKGGIYLKNTVWWTIDSNIIGSGVSEHGIYLLGNSCDHRITNNTIVTPGGDAIKMEKGAEANGPCYNQISGLFVLTPTGYVFNFADSGAQHNRIRDSHVYTTGSVLNDIGSDNKFKNVQGYVTSNSGSSTGTGAQQTIAHGLATTPNLVMVGNIENGANPYQSATANATNIYITAGNGLDYWWKAEI